ncbi:hypothetical protein [Streptomyces sp. NPDC002640]
MVTVQGTITMDCVSTDLDTPLLLRGTITGGGTGTFNAQLRPAAVPDVRLVHHRLGDRVRQPVRDQFLHLHDGAQPGHLGDHRTDPHR